MKENNINSNLSVILIMGWLLKKLPIFMVQKFLSYAIQSMYKKHPRVFEKLKTDNLTFVIDAIDLPFVFYLDPSNIELCAYYKTEAPQCSATIKGKLVDLLLLFEGEKDGDAMFFSKELIIEGSTAAIVNLRNTIDSEDMNIMEDLSGNNPIFKSIIKVALKGAVVGHNKMQKFLDNLTESINYNSNQKHQDINNKLNDIYQDIDDFKTFVYEYKKQQIRKKSDYKEKPNN